MLVVATGAALLPEETEGLPGRVGRAVFTFYTLDGAPPFVTRLLRFDPAGSS